MHICDICYLYVPRQQIACYLCFNRCAPGLALTAALTVDLLVTPAMVVGVSPPPPQRVTDLPHYAKQLVSPPSGSCLMKIVDSDGNITGKKCKLTMK